MTKIGKVKTLKGKCPVCENRFKVTADDFIITKNIKRGSLSPMIHCPWCKTWLYKEFGFFGETIWNEPYWEFKVGE